MPARKIIDETRRHGIAVIAGDLVPGVTAIAAPIFDHRGRVVASIALLGSPENLDPSPDTRPAAALKTVATTISERLGYRATELPAG